MTFPEKYKILIITLSDRASRGEYDDLSGPRVEELLMQHFSVKEREISVKREIIPDNSDSLRTIVEAGSKEYNVIITTGGTGIGPRDITVDVIQPMLDKEIPGVMELIRVKYGMQKPNAALSRGVAGLIGISLVYTLPGSVKAVNEYMTEILTTMEHLIYMQYGVDVHGKVKG